MITEEVTTQLDVKLERAMLGDGALAAHSHAARIEAAMKLSNNFEKVVLDICNKAVVFQGQQAHAVEDYEGDERYSWVFFTVEHYGTAAREDRAAVAATGGNEAFRFVARANATAVSFAWNVESVGRARCARRFLAVPSDCTNHGLSMGVARHDFYLHGARGAEHEQAPASALPCADPFAWAAHNASRVWLTCTGGNLGLEHAMAPASAGDSEGRPSLERRSQIAQAAGAGAQRVAARRPADADLQECARLLSSVARS